MRAIKHRSGTNIDGVYCAARTCTDIDRKAANRRRLIISSEQRIVVMLWAVRSLNAIIQVHLQQTRFN